MSIPIYGDSAPKPCPDTSPLTVDRLVEYLNRSTSIIIGLVQDGNKERALGRLNVIRQEIALLTDTSYVPLTITTTITGTLHNNT